MAFSTLPTEVTGSPYHTRTSTTTGRHPLSGVLTISLQKTRSTLTPSPPLLSPLADAFPPGPPHHNLQAQPLARPQLSRALIPLRHRPHLQQLFRLSFGWHQLTRRRPTPRREQRLRELQKSPLLDRCWLCHRQGQRLWHQREYCPAGKPLISALHLFAHSDECDKGLRAGERWEYTVFLISRCTGGFGGKPFEYHATWQLTFRIPSPEKSAIATSFIGRGGVGAVN